MYQKCIDLLASRGVTIHDISECVVFLQKSYHNNLDPRDMEDFVINVIQKREVQHAIITGIELDILAERHLLLDDDLQRIIETDESLYGMDEVLAYGICHLYGSIALTNYGYIDRVKPGIIGKLNEATDGLCHTFLDDIVGAIAASAASRAAHHKE